MHQPAPLKNSRLIGVGSYLPEQSLDNESLGRIKNLDTSDEWIQKRSGIKRRHIAAKGEFCSDLGVKAAQAALLHAGLNAEDIDLIIVATTTPDNIFPATATRIQAKLGAGQGIAFDIQAVCSGFIYALSQADNMLKLGKANRALVIGCETYSRIMDWSDRGTCVLFGDGAGAIILEACLPDLDKSASQQIGVLDTHILADGRYYDHLYVDGGPGSTGTSGFVRMDGKDVFRHAVHKMTEAVQEICARNQFTTEDINWLIPHQANQRIIEMVGEKLNIPIEKVIVTVANHANTSSATIPLALDHGFQSGKIKAGDLIALTALGGGFAWGSALLRC